jgi:hypothetical protein
MDWDQAINRQCAHLSRIIAALFVMAGLGNGASNPVIPAPVRRAVLRILYPAESAVRRLIVVMTRGLVAGRASFQLCDPRRVLFAIDRARGPRFEPRIHAFSEGQLVTIVGRSPRDARPAACDADRTARLCRRLHAIKSALEDLPRQAQRLARWRARASAKPPEKFRKPLRLGPPPGHVRQSSHEVDEVLKDCHWLAWEAAKLDSS